MLITIATDKHKASIEQRVQEMHAASQYSDIKYSASKIQLLINSMIHDQNSVILIAVDDDGEVHGFLALEEVQYFFNYDTFVSDLAFYVTPAKRSTTVPYRLLRAGEDWARLHGKALVLGVTAPTDPQKVVDMYTKCGFKQWGIVMRKDL